MQVWFVNIFVLRNIAVSCFSCCFLKGHIFVFMQIVQFMHGRVDPFQNQIVLSECCLFFLCEVIYIGDVFFSWYLQSVLLNM